MAYGYYQQSARPGWGTNQYQFGPPPTPKFQPQPSWGGTDFYRAHAVTSDPYLFDHAWNRVQEFGGAPAGGMGVGLHEARHWHRRAYGGLNEISMMAPNEVGHAAAYEAYRTWIHNSSMYEPLSGDIERQREALTGLAVAEAARLLQFSARPADNYARLAATEAAAHTASYIFYQSRDGDYRSRSQHRSFEDPYAYDDELVSPRARSHSRARSGHRHRSLSRHSAYSQSGRMPYPVGQTYSSSSISGVPQTAFPGQAGSYGSSSYGGGMHNPLHGSPYNPNGVPIGGGSAYGATGPMGMGMGMGVSPTSANYPMQMGASPSYHGSSLGAPPVGYSRSRSSSFSYPQQQQYPQQPYMGSSMSASGIPGMGSAMSASGMGMGMGMGMPGHTPSQTIIIHKSRKPKHRHHKRSRSSEPDYGHRSSSRY